MSEQRLMTIKEAAERLGISTELMRRFVWSGQISYIDMNKGGRVIHARFTEKHLEDFLKQQEVKAR